nr:hypothetical protein [uncultured Acetatifactor sp.]
MTRVADRMDSGPAPATSRFNMVEDISSTPNPSNVSSSAAATSIG